jgi:hypothetical protein
MGFRADLLVVGAQNGATSVWQSGCYPCLRGLIISKVDMGFRADLRVVGAQNGEAAWLLSGFRYMCYVSCM